jgi:hypothetical protein
MDFALFSSLDSDEVALFSSLVSDENMVSRAWLLVLGEVPVSTCQAAVA